MLSSKYGKYLPSVILLILSTWILTENILENKVIDSNMLGKGITYDGAPEHREYTTGSSTPHGSTGICIP